MTPAQPKKPDDGGREAYIKGLIRRRYRHLAEIGSGGRDKALAAGYPQALLDRLPKAVVAGWSGCGALAANLDFHGGEVVVDVGAGSGLDAFVLATAPAAQRPLVIAVDLTPEALSPLAGGTPVCAVVGDFEALPFPDMTCDAVIANAAFNLALDVEAAFAEALRILKPGGRLHMCELVRDHELDPELMSDPMGWGASLGGVLRPDRLLEVVDAVGFAGISVHERKPFPPVTAIRVDARRPTTSGAA